MVVHLADLLSLEAIHIEYVDETFVVETDYHDRRIVTRTFGCVCEIGSCKDVERPTSTEPFTHFACKVFPLVMLKEGRLDESVFQSVWIVVILGIELTFI